MKRLSSRLRLPVAFLLVCGAAIFPAVHGHESADGLGHASLCNRNLHSILHAAHSLLQSIVSPGRHDPDPQHCCCVEGHHEDCSGAPLVAIQGVHRDRVVFCALSPDAARPSYSPPELCTPGLVAWQHPFLPPPSLRLVLSVQLLI